MHLSLFCAAAVALLATPVFAQTQWTVDPAGGGHFTSLQAAIDNASPNDVLLLMPGTHTGATSSKRLRFIGTAASNGTLPFVPSLDVQGGTSVAIKRLHFGRLRLFGLSARSEVDSCTIHSGSWLISFGMAPFVIQDCANVLVTRTTTRGLDGVDAHNAAAVWGSKVQFVQCEALGGNGKKSPEWSGFGGHGLVVADGSQVWLVDTSARGGVGEDWHQPLSISQQGRPGHGVELDPSYVRFPSGPSLLWLRGSPDHVLQPGPPTPMSGPMQGLSCTQPAQVWTHVQGTTVVSTNCGPMLQTLPFVMTRLTLHDIGTSGHVVEARVFGTPAAQPYPVALVASFAGNWAPTGDLTTLHFVDLSQIALIQWGSLHQHLVPAVFPLLLPNDPALKGLRISLQAFAVWPSGSLNGSNGHVIVLG